MEEDFMPMQFQVPELVYGTGGEMETNGMGIDPIVYDDEPIEIRGQFTYNNPIRIPETDTVTYAQTIRNYASDLGIHFLDSTIDTYNNRRRTLVDYVKEMGEFNKINQEDKQELINKINQIL